MKNKEWEKRFWAKVQIGAPDTCWLWIGNKTIAGYGRFGLNLATHLALTLDGRPREENKHALHSCDNPSCVNPSHLRWGTHSDNMRDGVSRGRHAQTRKTHCPKGHEYSVGNTYNSPNHGRICRTCKRASKAAARLVAR